MVAFSTRARFRKHFQERKARLSPYTCILEIRTISFPLIHSREKSRAVKYSPSTKKTPFSSGIKKEGSSSIYLYPYTCILEIRTIFFPLIHFREKSRAVKYSPSTRKTPFFTGIKKGRRKKERERNGCIEDEKFGGARFISAK